MISSWKILGIFGAVTAASMMAMSARGDDFSFGFRGNVGRPAVPTAQQRFLGQSQVRQQAFFAQPVFPHAPITPLPPVPFAQTWTLQQPTWVSRPVNNYLPPLFYSGYQPGFYVAPTVYNYNSSYYGAAATVVYSSPQPMNIYSNSSAPGFGRQQPRPNFGMGGRW